MILNLLVNILRQIKLNIATSLRKNSCHLRALKLMKKQVTTPKLRLVFDEPLLTLKLAGGGGGVVESLLGFLV